MQCMHNNKPHPVCGDLLSIPHSHKGIISLHMYTIISYFYYYIYGIADNHIRINTCTQY